MFLHSLFDLIYKFPPHFQNIHYVVNCLEKGLNKTEREKCSISWAPKNQLCLMILRQTRLGPYPALNNEEHFIGFHRYFVLANKTIYMTASMATSMQLLCGVQYAGPLLALLTSLHLNHSDFPVDFTYSYKSPTHTYLNFYLCGDIQRHNTTPSP